MKLRLGCSYRARATARAPARLYYRARVRARLQRRSRSYHIEFEHLKKLQSGRGMGTGTITTIRQRLENTILYHLLLIRMLNDNSEIYSDFRFKMPRSMTACSRITHDTPLAKFSLELFSVNRRHLEIQTFLPKELSSFDPEVRQLISSHISRGIITVKFFVQYHQKAPTSIIPNLSMAKQVKEAWEQIEKELGIRDSFNLALLASQYDFLRSIEELSNLEAFRDDLLNALKDALHRLIEMKELEGKHIQIDLKDRLHKLRSAIEEIAKRSANATTKYRQKLQQRIVEIVGSSIELDERIIREVALFAEKVDITEEITRFISHLCQCEAKINSVDPAIGKLMEFLLQELLREANTIGSKASDMEITHLVVEIKSEIERIREQIQNIE